MPARTSPLPADASPGLPLALMRHSPSGVATTVPQPLSATWALKRFGQRQCGFDAVRLHVVGGDAKQTRRFCGVGGEQGGLPGGA
jgi:hypothetical protein